MGNDNKPGRIGTIGEYIRKAVKFYGLKKDNIAAIIFSVTLAIGFSAAFIPDKVETTDPVYIGFTVLSMLLIHIASSIYLLASIRDLRGEDYSLRECTYAVLRKLPSLLAAIFTYVLIIVLGTVLLIIPGVIAYLTYFFNTCYIVDKGKGAKAALFASKSLTNGKKLELLSIILLFRFLLLIPAMFAIMSFLNPGNTLVLMFVFSFVSAITNLMEKRLTALLYIDLEYGNNE